MNRKLYASLLILSSIVSCGLGGSGSTAATFNDPTWPCQQRKVESLSLGLMWPKPVEDSKGAAPLSEDALNLADRLSLRRVSLEEAEPLVATFADAHESADKHLLGRVFQTVFDKLDKHRSRIIAGIGRYSLKQVALAEKIDQTRGRMDELMAAEPPDFDAVDKLEEQLDWDERIYHDRAKSLTYVCETPVLLEKRLYAIAKMLAKYVPEEN